MSWKTLFELSRVKLYTKLLEGKWKLVRVSERFEWFEFSRVRVTEGKITVNVWTKSKGNRFWFEFELARVWIIGIWQYATNYAQTGRRSVRWGIFLDFCPETESIYPLLSRKKGESRHKKKGNVNAWRVLREHGPWARRHGNQTFAGTR